MNYDIVIILRESYESLLRNNSDLKVSDLEAEIINLASYVYLKDADEIDFTLNYLDQQALDTLGSFDFDVVDEVIDEACVLFPANYTEEKAANAKEAVRMNMELAKNYGAFLKSYFISKHKISDGNSYENFSSPLNSLWRNGIKQSESPTIRDVNYKLDMDSNIFEVLVNPYNPLVSGDIILKNPEIITGLSTDKTREFEFLFKNGELYEVVMHRLDKEDTVKYHK